MPSTRITDVYALSPMQHGMLLHTLESGEAGLYLDQLEIDLSGDLDLSAFSAAWAGVVARHAVLRTSFYWEALEEPQQVVFEHVTLQLALVDLGGLPPSTQEAEVDAFLQDDRRHGFALSIAPLSRVTLFRLDTGRWRAVWSYHHILLDGWSAAVVLSDLLTLYVCSRQGREPALAPAPRFRDYIAWLRRQDGEAARMAWQRALAGFEAPLVLAGDLPAAAGPPQLHEVRLQMTQAATAALAATARRQQVTVNTLVQGAWALVLSRYCNSHDIVFGAVVSGRPPELAGSESTVGLFINTLPVRVTVDPEAPPAAWLKNLQDRQVELAPYSYPSLATIQGWSEVLAGLPLFESILLFENFPAPLVAERAPAALNIAIRNYWFASHYPLTLTVWPGAELLLRLQYNSRRFYTTTARRILDHFASLLAGLSGEDATGLDGVPMLSAAERQQLVLEWNDTGGMGNGNTGEAEEICLHEKISAQAMKQPTADAVVTPTLKLTYGDLEQQANRLALHLQQLGVGPDSLVGVCLERDTALVPALLGVLKAGAAYVPLDPAYPDERLALMLADARVQLLLTRQGLAERLTAVCPAVAAASVCLDRDAGAIASQSDRAPIGRSAVPANLAYVIYTSGSTGRPKGVAISHANAAALVRWIANEYRPEELGGVLAGASICFDMSVFELWTTLALGGQVILAGHALELRRLPATEVKLLSTVPSLMAELLRTGEIPAGVRIVNLGGEPLTARLARQIEQLGTVDRLYNLYGPTEDTTYSTASCVSGEEVSAPSIGRPCAGRRAYVLDRAMRPVPVGVTGELYLGGEGQARGYLGRPELTAERFLPQPLPGADQPGARLYRTGDLARQRPDGRLDLLGRRDHQVKIRGCRIELGEIEATLSRQSGVREAVVLAITDANAGQRLVAYVVMADGEALNASDLRAALARELPYYMVPAAVVFVATLPLTATGKVDRRALLDREPIQADLPASRAPLAGKLEQTIGAIWAEVLGVATVGRDDHFFDLGGNSLLMLRVQGQLRERLGCEVPVVELFTYPTVAELADQLARTAEPSGEEIAATPASPDVGQPERPGADTWDRGAPTDRQGAIAVVGITGRFPGAASVEELWRRLCAGDDCITCLSDEELLAAGVEPRLLAHPRYVRARGVLADSELFDAPFFGLTAREATITDPQHRLFLECAWEVLEDAGYGAGGELRSVGVFAGAGINSYLLNLFSQPKLAERLGFYEARLASDKDYLATRVSYLLDLKGPSVTVQTACSTSLVAVHLACQSLRLGECDLAIAGGVSAGGSPKSGYLYDEGGILSPDGKCRAFDAAARGTVGGNGVAAVALRRLADALAAGDSIRAVILGSAINNDGAAKVGFTAPSVEGQAAAIREALEGAGIAAESLGYVETHGTGTRVGDPIEIAALKRAFATTRRGFCAVGSIKTNIGHLDAAAGVAGLIKAVLAVESGQIPPSLHYECPNPEIDFATSPFFVNTRLTPWPDAAAPRRASVSSFGLGGTNAHIVIEQPPLPATSGESRSWQLLPLSARTGTALLAASTRLAAHLRQRPEQPLADVAYTLQRGRRAFSYGRVVVAQDGESAAAALAGERPEALFEGSAGEEVKGVAFLFPGQGTQYLGMAREIYQTERLFREIVDHCAEELTPRLGLDLRRTLYETAAGDLAAAVALEQPLLSHLATFVIEYALSQLWLSWGVRPVAMLGHSLGEYVAACVAGVLKLEDALAVVAERGRQMESLPPGAMLALPLSEVEVAARLAPGSGFERISVATVNGPSLTVVSGPVADVEELARCLAGEGMDVKMVPVRRAMHSPAMAPVVEPLLHALARAELRLPRIPYLSNLTGRWIQPEQATDRSYWAMHLCQTVRFAEGLQELLALPGLVLLEVGPGRTLSRLARRHSACTPQRTVLSTLPSQSDSKPADAFLLETLGRLWLAGIAPDWRVFSGDERRRRVKLPTYPFERQRYWLEPGRFSGLAVPQRRADCADWFYVPHWRPGAPLRTLPVKTPAARWLIFLDGCGLGEHLVTQLIARQAAISTVRLAEHFARIGPSAYTIDPQHAEDYAALLASLETEGGLPTAIVHLWTVDGGTPDGSEKDCDRLLDFGGWSALALAQALEKVAPGGNVEIGFAVDSLHRVRGDEPVRPGKAILLGACRVIAQEMPHLRCRVVDLDLRSAALDEAAACLLAELAAESTELLVAWRGSARLVPGLAPVRLGSRPPQPVPLRDRGTYLLTGGLGGMGLALADYLTRTVRARLVLVGRSVVPARELWPALLANGAPDETATVRRLAALEAQGAELLVLAADVTDEDAMRRVLGEVHERFGRVHGVVHCAGTAGGRLARLTTREELLRVLAPKVRGTLVLDELLQEEDLDFFLLASSLTALLGGIGQAAYCAANCYLDAFAEARQARGSAAISVAWDLWREAGMALKIAAPAQMEADLEDEISRGLSNGEGAEVFHRALWSGLPRLAISVENLPARSDRFESAVRSRISRQTVPNAGNERLSTRPVVTRPYVPPANELESRIARMVGELLGLEPVGRLDDFFELGGHSLLATQLLSRLRDTFHVEIPIKELFADATVEAIAGGIARQQAAAVTPDLLEQVLAEIRGLSEEDVKRRLAQPALPVGGEIHG